VLSWFILVPLAGLILLNLPLGEALGKRAFAAVLALSLAQIAAVLAVPVGVWDRPGPLVSFLDLHLRAGNLGLVMLLCIALAVAAAALVGSATVADRRPRFVSVLLISLMGMNGAVLVTDLFSLYVFLEVVALSSFVLIAFNRDGRGLEGAFKYLILGAVASILIVTSVAVLLLVGGGTSFNDVAKAVASSPNAVIVRIALGAFLCGLLIKGGLIPFHGWVLGAYSAAPAATSVLLAGIATKVSGIYALIRVVATILPSIAPIHEVLLAAGAVSIVIGALAAMAQTDIKRLLAYSSISQMGYIILGLGCGTPLALAGVVFHLFNHCIAKSLLFVNSAALEQRLSTTDMNSMGGLGSRMPVTSVTSAIGALSTAGIPPLSGFWSKAIIVLALWQADQHVYAGLAVLLSVATLAYMLLLQRKVFFGKIRQELAAVKEASWQLVVCAVALAAITTAAGLLFPLLWGSFLVPSHGGL
jgi:multicomponent Na+:H+ antiporter subunit D